MSKAFSVPDATVSGNFKSKDYNAKLSSVLSCIDNEPTGNFNMLTSGSGVWRITSNTPSEINTEANNLSDHVHAVFIDSTVVHETAGKKYTNCTAFFDAVEWPLGGGVKGINVTLVVFQGSNTKPVFEWDGIFTGTMKVVREVSCGD